MALFDGLFAPRVQTNLKLALTMNVPCVCAALFYWTHGVTGHCFEKASGTYLYRNGQFVLVVDSD
jgi:hypothetical protein